MGEMARVSPDAGTGTGGGTDADAETDTAAVVRRLRDAMAGGVLAFPLTAFRDDGTLDPDGQRAYLARRLAAGPGAPIAALGIPACSSAVHAFTPEIADACFTALRDGDHTTVDTLLRDFHVPFVELRDRTPGYAVSLVKAAARLRGRPVGPVRAPPLTDPSPSDLTDLKALLTAGLDLVGAAL
ncbi:beta/alpha barrel domain-containing protein [Streptomyces hirsutus]|uniref:hypothetical protein n=1 Tax=Streptomyces hirsutus TaxID=35620 RepID=UPI0036AEC739